MTQGRTHSDSDLPMDAMIPVAEIVLPCSSTRRRCSPWRGGDPAVRPVLPVHGDPAPPIPGLLSPAALVEVPTITVAAPEVTPPSPAWSTVTEQPSAVRARA